MTIYYINTGTSPNAGNGDSLRTAFTKINTNFGTLVEQLSGIVVGTTSTLVAGTYTFALSNTGEVTLNGEPFTSGGGGASSVIVSETAPTLSTGKLWFNSLDGRIYIAYNNDWVDASPTEVPDPVTYLDGLDINGTTISAIDTSATVSIQSGENIWQFGTDGILNLPDNIGDIYRDGVSVLGAGTGSVGPTGPTGGSGPRGPQGVAGPSGVAGPTGAQGIDGPTGAQGIDGPSGAQGIVGPSGPAGINGQNGINGAPGRDGIDGAPGRDGLDGLNGTNGSNGADGAPGRDGIDGAPGRDGLDGLNGTNGADGSKGDKGDTGEQGISIVLVGSSATTTVASLGEGSVGQGWINTTDGNVYFWNTLTVNWENIGPIVGPQGDKGDSGDKGEKGDTGQNGQNGQDGRSAYELAVLGGFVGTQTDWLASLVGPSGADGIDGVNGQNGQNGQDGRSAYELAVLGGFVGTQSDWLSSLIGPAGADGTDGVNGQNGQNGQDGRSAFELAVLGGFEGTQEDWLASLVGQNGQNGLDGPQGPQGEPGFEGPTGPSGANGLDGPQGPQGEPGFEGPTGPSGAQGEPGFEGPTGPSGAQGEPGTDALWNYTAAYNGGASYAVGDLATYGGQLYYRKHANGGNMGDTPFDGSTFWDLIAAKGDTGGGGGGNPFDQDLNTYDDVVFANLRVTSTTTFLGSVVYGQYEGYDDLSLIKDEPVAVALTMRNLHNDGSSEIVLVDSYSGGLNISHQNSSQGSGNLAAGENYIHGEGPPDTLNIGLYSNINFFADSNKYYNTNDATTSSMQISNIDGSVKFNKTVFAGDILPNTDNFYNLGSPTQQWNHIYVNTGSIYLGSIKLSTENNQLVVQEVTNIDGDERVVQNYALANADRLVAGDVSAVLTPDATLTFNTETRITVAGIPGPTAPNAWYNIFGELNNSTSTNITIDGSVVYDTEGNLYVLGSITDFASEVFAGVNLFLKYSPQGELLWRKTWTDDSGDSCGSYNASLRFQPMAGTATIDTIVWASNGESWGIDYSASYVGTMDLEGNLVDIQGQPRAPLSIPDYRITDIAPAVAAYEFFGYEAAYVSGSWYDRADTEYNYASIAGVYFNETGTNVNFVFHPADSYNYNNGGYFKSINVIGTSTVWATGAYCSNEWNGGTFKTILGVIQGNEEPQPSLYTIGANYSAHSMWIEDSGSDADDNIYVLINVWGYNQDTRSQSNSYTVLASTSPYAISSIDRWQKKITRVGDDDGGVTTHGLGLVNHDGYVYVSLYLYDNSGNDSDIALLKLHAETGVVVWARTIGSPSSEGSWNTGENGYGSSSDITVDPTGTYISFTANTQDQSTSTQWSNNFTIQYPLDGSLLGTFNDFSITDSTADFVITDHDFDVVDITESTTINGLSLAVSTATLTATATAVGTGWTNFYWPLEETGPAGTADKTWTFGSDGNLTIPGNITKDGQTITIDVETSGSFTATIIGVQSTTTDLLIGNMYQGVGIQADGAVVIGSKFNTSAPVVIFGAPNLNEGENGGDVLIQGGFSQVGQNGSVHIEGQYAEIFTFDGLQILDGNHVGWTFDNSDLGLVFPDDTTQYTAWQGSTIVSDTAPSDDLGRIWFNSTDGRAYVKYNDNWVDMSPQVIPSPATYLEGLIIEDTTIAKTTYADGKSISIDNEGKVVVLKTTGELQVPGDLTPETTGTQKLGTASKRWKEAHIEEIHTTIDGGGASTWLTAD